MNQSWGARSHLQNVDSEWKLPDVTGTYFERTPTPIENDIPGALQSHKDFANHIFLVNVPL